MYLNNKVRGMFWILFIFIIIASGLWDTERGVSIRMSSLWRVFGIVLLFIIFRAAGVTGRYLKVYGCMNGHGITRRLVREGPYSCMRHPMHFFLALFPVAVALVLASVHAIIISLIEYFIIIILTLYIDEKETIDRFGDRYLEYKEKTPAINPSYQCILKALLKKPPLELREKICGRK